MKKWILLVFLTFSGLVWSSEMELIDEVKVVTLEDGREILAASNGLSLYTFDVDAPGESRCFGQCLVIWPALSTDKEKVEKPFGIHHREDGTKQLTLNDEPLYFFISDQNEGDILGEGLNGVWHLIEL